MNVEERLTKLEQHSHKPVDFTPQIDRITKLEARCLRIEGFLDNHNKKIGKVYQYALEADAEIIHLLVLHFVGAHGIPAEAVQPFMEKLGELRKVLETCR